MSWLLSYGKYLLKIRIVAPLRSLFLRIFGAPANKDGWENHLLIVNLEALGDLVVFTSVLKHYKKRFPDKKIYLLIKSRIGLEGVLEREFVDEVLPVNYRKFAVSPIYGARMINKLRRIGFQRVVNHDFSGAEIIGKMICTSLGAEKIEGYEGMSFETRKPFDLQQKKNLRVFRGKTLPFYTKTVQAIDGSADLPEKRTAGEKMGGRRLPSAIRHYIAIYEGVTGFREDDYSTHLPAGDATDGEETLERFGLKRKKYAVINVNASTPYKRWPLGRLSKLVEFLDDRGVSVALVGTTSELPRVREFEEVCPVPMLNVAGKTSLEELLNLVGGALLVITNDTSLVHIAVAKKIPSLAIVGGGQFGMFSNYGYPEINKWVYSKRECFGDNWRCAKSVALGEPAPCVSAITIDMALEKLQQLIDYLGRAQNTSQHIKFLEDFGEEEEKRHAEAALRSSHKKGLTVVYAGIQAENYNPQRKVSFEYSNFYATLKNMPGLQVIEYPYDPIIKIGKRRFNEDLLKLVKEKKPDLFFAFMFTDELIASTLRQIKQLTTSVAWFADDHWRLWNYSRYYAPHFTWAVTTWSRAPEIYAKYGIKNIIRSQWACNPEFWRPVNTPRDINVSFVGQHNSAREKVVKELRKKGADVWVRGWGWPEGRLSREEVVKSFSRTKINLNFNTPPAKWRLRALARLFFKRSAGRIIPDFFHFADNFRSWRNMSIPQIKARPFEILACKTFLISGYADDMGKYYEDGKEVVYYDGTIEDLVKKIKYYLVRDEERERIARAGHERTTREHTYEKRFLEVFRRIGLQYKE